jgi:hypothetical protein
VCFAQSFVPPLRGCVADAHCGYGITPSDSQDAVEACGRKFDVSGEKNKFPQFIA